MQRTTEEYRDYVEHKLRDAHKRIDRLSDEVGAIKLEIADSRDLLSDNSAATARVEQNTAEMLAVFESWRGAMKVMEMIGRLAKPLGYIVGLGASVAAFWAAMKSGVSPK